LRRDGEGELAASFPLNRHQGASILVAGKNFGSGSSREAAIYALVDAGFRAVFASSFGDIFASNAVNNGLLPARVSEDASAFLREAIGEDARQATVDLETREITIGSRRVGFELDENWRTKLMNGWDDIDLTLQRRAEIEQFRTKRKQAAPWAWPTALPGTAG
ncbi:3-isopropylmalate dehydratase small subunit, partial [Cribrihabitans sp. XS_ASV171]